MTPEIFFILCNNNLTFTVINSKYFVQQPCYLPNKTLKNKNIFLNIAIQIFEAHVLNRDIVVPTEGHASILAAKS
jgi:hypothetical protein